MRAYLRVSVCLHSCSGVCMCVSVWCVSLCDLARYQTGCRNALKVHSPSPMAPQQNRFFMHPPVGVLPLLAAFLLRPGLLFRVQRNLSSTPVQLRQSVRNAPPPLSLSLLPPPLSLSVCLSVSLSLSMSLSLSLSVCLSLSPPLLPPFLSRSRRLRAVPLR